MGPPPRRRSPSATSSIAASRALCPKDFDAAVARLKRGFVAEAPKIATRQSSQKVLEALVPVLPELVGGSADLTGSNNTKTKDDGGGARRRTIAGRYIYYGVREHGMAAAMNGIALHRRLHPLWRHLPRLHRLLPPGDPPRRPDGPARHLCDDP